MQEPIVWSHIGSTLQRLEGLGARVVVKEEENDMFRVWYLNYPVSSHLSIIDIFGWLLAFESGIKVGKSNPSQW